jgi:outer membrane receptor for ferrienterochelin and colicins
MKRTFVLSVVASAALFGAENIGTVTVEDVAERLERAGALKDVIVKTEVVTEGEIAKKQATNLSEAIDNEPGIQSATGCSMCGMKRVRINGMKGEHTTVLVDDVPMHSTVSSYYGMDALTTAGISSIEVARGAGASLIAPGAIGGVINVKSKKATENSLFLDVSAGNDDFRNLSLVGTGVSDDRKTRATVSAQSSKQGQWDADDNGVNESPELVNRSASIRVSHDVTENDNVDFRYTTQQSNVFGGPVTDDHHNAMMDDPDRSYSFVDGDVRKRYNGDPLDTLEAIDTTREEVIGRWTRQIDDESNIVVTGSYANQVQDSVYEGDTYYSEDDTSYGDIRYNTFIGEEHFLTAGIDGKIEEMDSTQNITPDQDDFDMNSYGLYLQDTWTPTDYIEVAAAVRVDSINVDWTDQSGTELDETVIVPRLHVKYDHENGLVSRLSAGQGYRAPLTFFESEHGLLDNGFAIDIDDIEKSNSAGYSLSYDGERTTATASFNWTQIENLAYIDDEGEVPTLRNADETMNVMTADIVAGYQLTSAFSVGGSFEYFNYDDEYKAHQFLAQIEERAKLMIDYEADGWMANLTATWVGSRNLDEYGYEGWNVFNDANENGEVDAGELQEKKGTDSPTYYTVDLKLSKAVTDNFTLYAGVKNLLDYTQAGDEDTPLFFDAEGGYDVGYIYGPLRGRQYYAGLQAKF